MTAEAELGLPDLDPVIHAQARLRITSTLAALPDGDRVTFPRLQDVVEMTAGNLSTHLRKLEAAGYISMTKTFSGRTPVTWVALTRRGRVAFEDYTTALHAYLRPDPPAPSAPPTTRNRTERG